MITLLGNKIVYSWTVLISFKLHEFDIFFLQTVWLMNELETRNKQISHSVPIIWEFGFISILKVWRDHRIFSCKRHAELSVDDIRAIFGHNSRKNEKYG